jgi:hypothetical protein
MPNKTRLKVSSLLLLGALAAIALAAVPTASAQGCALCYQSAASAGARSIQALRNGIVILVIPPFFICTAITYLVYRRRNFHNQDA